MAFSVIIPSRNPHNLAACIGAIRAAGETCRVIVVWDGDGPRPCFGDPSMLTVPGRKPFSWPRNVNLGIMAAGEDDVCIMGDDALVKTERGLTMMHEAMGTEVGVISAACNGVGNLNQMFKPPTFGGDGSMLVRPEPRMLCFICVMIPRSVINSVGLLDERFNTYAAGDDDYSYRVRRAGLKLGVFDGCFVDHESLPSTFRQPGMDSSLEHGKRMFREKWGIENDDA